MDCLKSYLLLSPGVRVALDRPAPVVALETSFLAHGLPYPENLRVAREMAAIISGKGAVPAFTGVGGGKLRVGLGDRELEHMARQGGEYFKASASDLGPLLAGGGRGATTVASLVYIARLAGIKICATGGIGGVHRGGHRSFDISQDLVVLGRTPVALVCTGAKIILDIGLTLEYLETLGIPVIGYRTRRFPSFFSRSTPYRLDHRAGSPGQVAQVLLACHRLGHPGGIIIANPVPREDSLGEGYLDFLVRRALGLARQEGISGKALTPFLLEQLSRLSRGRTLRSNLSLLKHNASLAAEISVRYFSLKGAAN